MMSTYYAGPALIGTAMGVRLPHEVGALVVVHDLAAHVRLAGRDGGRALQRDMALQRVGNVLAGRGAQSLEVGLADGGDGGVLLVEVAAGEGGVVGPAVVVGAADGVEGVNRVRLGQALAVAVGAAVGGAGVGLDHVERAVGHVAGETLAERRLAMEARRVGAAARARGMLRRRIRRIGIGPGRRGAGEREAGVATVLVLQAVAMRVRKLRMLLLLLLLLRSQGNRVLGETVALVVNVKRQSSISVRVGRVERVHLLMVV